MSFDNRQLIGIILIVLLIIWVVYPLFEGFNADGTEFVPVGGARYGLRGDLLRRSSIKKFFIRPDRRIKLSHSGGEMGEGDYSPVEFGEHDCTKVECPSNGYDNLDKCWQCGKDHYKFNIPNIWPHVPN